MCGWTVITPALAIELLKKNTRNYRAYKERIAKQYAADMLSGNWKQNGAPIIITKSGYIADGQHRLHAIIIANVPVRMFVIDDVNDKETDFLDMGATRTGIQIAKANGLSANTLDMGLVSIIVNGGALSKGTPKGVAFEYLKKNYETVRTATNIVSATKGPAKKAACAAIAYCMLRTGEMSEGELRSFFKVVNSGNPAYATTDVTSACVLRCQLAGMHGGGQTNQYNQLEITVKALNDFHSGTSRKNRYTTNTTNAENLIRRVKELDAPFQMIA